MGIIKEEIRGTKILNEIESTNIVRTEYDTATKKMIVEFKHGFYRRQRSISEWKCLCCNKICCGWINKINADGFITSWDQG